MLSGYKTVVYGIALMLISILSNPAMAEFVAEHLPWVGGSAGAIVIILRAITTSTVFKKPQ